MTSALSLFAEPETRRPVAVFSPCAIRHVTCVESCEFRRYRYVLAWPTGVANDQHAVFCLANPSSATADKTDPTVARCIEFARLWGHGWCYVVNARAWRATDPKDVPADPLAIGPDNDAHIYRVCARAEIVVCGWGKLAGARADAMLDLIRSAGKVPHALQLNGDGSPSHPLTRGKRRIPADAVPFAMVGGAR